MAMRGGAPSRDLAMTYDLFISHSSADAKAALALVNEIESRGILKCWVAPRDIPIGASYQREIVRAIRNCGGVLLLLSDNANESDHESSSTDRKSTRLNSSH